MRVYVCTLQVHACGLPSLVSGVPNCTSHTHRPDVSLAPASRQHCARLHTCAAPLSFLCCDAVAALVSRPPPPPTHTHKHMKNQTNTGHETTAAVLTWALFCVVQNPEAEARLLAEIDSVVGDRVPGARARVHACVCGVEPRALGAAVHVTAAAVSWRGCTACGSCGRHAQHGFGTATASNAAAAATNAAPAARHTTHQAWRTSRRCRMCARRSPSRCACTRSPRCSSGARSRPTRCRPGSTGTPQATPSAQVCVCVCVCCVCCVCVCCWGVPSRVGARMPGCATNTPVCKRRGGTQLWPSRVSSHTRECHIRTPLTSAMRVLRLSPERRVLLPCPPPHTHTPPPPPHHTTPHNRRRPVHQRVEPAPQPLLVEGPRGLPARAL
jgi:hypothetical protein